MLGMTEAGSVCLVSDDEGDQPEHRRGSFGRPAPGFDARVLDPDRGEVCGTDEVGELWFRGPFLMEGYLGRERADVFDADGWFRTGDLVRVDADGFFFFTGRHGDMIKTSGANVSPREVEAAIAELTGLAAHVIGVDSDTAGQLVAAAVVVPAGRRFDDDDAEQLTRQLAARLSAYKVPKILRPLAEGSVPLMSSGKLDAPALRALLHE
jgi:acyl-CoA synthetase (AMP-forming)/AMP-acid ligase II